MYYSWKVCKLLKSCFRYLSTLFYCARLLIPSSSLNLLMVELTSHLISMRSVVFVSKSVFTFRGGRKMFSGGSFGPSKVERISVVPVQGDGGDFWFSQVFLQFYFNTIKNEDIGRVCICSIFWYKALCWWCGSWIGVLLSAMGNRWRDQSQY